jgi:cytidylate kinase
MIIAVDGPAGAGKSTVARKLAMKIGFTYLDTGAMYRALTLKALEQGIDFQDTRRLAKMASETAVDLQYGGDGSLKVLLDGKDVSFEIRQPRITRVVSDLAKVKEVRQVLVEIQRRLGRSKDSILDGRDIGTYVFPDAEIKYYIDAGPKERAKRRYLELKGANPGLKMEDVAQDLKNRDNIDSTREFAPLRRAPDAVYIDTTGIGIEEVVARMSAALADRK